MKIFGLVMIGMVVFVFLCVALTSFVRRIKCKRGKHSFEWDLLSAKYLHDGKCEAVVPSKCQYCQIISWEKTFEKVIHVWTNNMCERCKQERYDSSSYFSSVCSTCNGNCYMGNGKDQCVCPTCGGTGT